MRRLAIRSVLSAKAAEGRIVFVDSFEDLEPRTKAMVEVMNRLNIGDDTALIMTAEPLQNLEMAASNLPKVKTMNAALLSVVDMLKHNYIIMPRASLEIIDGILGSNGGRRKTSLRNFSGTRSLEVIARPRREAEAVAAAPEPEGEEAEAGLTPVALAEAGSESVDQEQQQEQAELGAAVDTGAVDEDEYGLENEAEVGIGVEDEDEYELQDEEEGEYEDEYGEGLEDEEPSLADVADETETEDTDEEGRA
jgi:hypothetical protein